MNRITGSIALFVLLFAAPAAAILPVDDFQAGHFALSSFTYKEQTIPIPGYSGHAMAASRKLIFSPGVESGSVFMSSTNVTPFTDYALTVIARGTSTARVHWDWGYARDLTVLGTIDCIEVLISGPPDGQVTAILTDASGGEGITLPTSGNIEVLTFFLSDFSLPDPTQAKTLGFRFDGVAAPGLYAVSEIRFRRSGSLNVDFLGHFVATQVPPIPSSPLAFSLRDQVGNQRYRADIVIDDAVAGGAVEMNAAWQSQVGAFGEQGVMEFRWDENGVFYDTFFTLFVDFTPVNGLIPEIYPPDPIQDDPTSFGLSFPMCIRDGSGAVMGESNTLLLFDVDPSQGAEFPSFTVTPRYASAAGGPGPAPSPSPPITGFELSFDIVGTSGVEVYEPLFHATWISDWTPAAVTGILDRRPVGQVLLQARPTVTRGATEVWSSQPFADNAQLGVYDVRGRRVNALTPAVGRQSVTWNGLDASGGFLPAGVYFLKLSDAGRTAVTRVTRLR